MSGIYIPGMEMPDRCFSCPLCNIEPNGESSCAKSLGPVIEYKEIDVETAIDTRPDWCPLVPVPAHGRLIDADALRHTYYHAPSFPNLCKAINEAPTVIPASKEGET